MAFPQRSPVPVNKNERRITLDMIGGLHFAQFRFNVDIERYAVAGAVVLRRPDPFAGAAVITQNRDEFQVSVIVVEPGQCGNRFHAMNAVRR